MKGSKPKKMPMGKPMNKLPPMPEPADGQMGNAPGFSKGGIKTSKKRKK